MILSDREMKLDQAGGASDYTAHRWASADDQVSIKFTKMWYPMLSKMTQEDAKKSFTKDFVEQYCTIEDDSVVTDKKYANIKIFILALTLYFSPILVGVLQNSVVQR